MHPYGIIVLLSILSFQFYVSEGQNATVATSTSILSETEITNAAFEDIAPCPCDLTGGSCDIECCCDGDCNDSERVTFASCIPYLPGGQSAETQRHLCSSQHFNPEDWFPFTCVVFEYNALLGYFYDWQFKLGTNIQTFLNRLSTASYYSYREQESRTVTDTNSSGYKYGISVKTGRPQASAVIMSGVLTLPQPTLTGQCLNTAPVRYLKDLESQCNYDISDAACTSNPVLNQLYFIQDSADVTFFSVLEEEAGIVIAETNVVYKCANAIYLSSYLKSKQVLSDIVDNTQSYTFNYTLPASNCMDSCGNDVCIDLNNLTNPDPISSPAAVPNCTVQIPTAPSNQTGTSCQNVVIDVDYKFKWVGNKIARLDATVIMAEVAFDNVLSQKYKVTFEHNETSVGNDSTDNFRNITDQPYERSGKVGYEMGKVINSGSVLTITSTSPEQFMYVNTNSTRQMALFDTTVDGLCAHAGRRSIMFGQDVTSSCKLMLLISQLADCSGLRKLIINRLNALMPSSVLGRRGYNDDENRGYWIDVLRDDLSTMCSLSELFPVGISPVDNRSGICYNITNGIHLDVLYGETGKSNNYPIYEILGSRISYTNTTWQVTCAGPASGVCLGTKTQPFYLTSSVKFTQIPPQTPTPVPKYYETPKEEDVQLCPRDICWDNLFYPFSGRYGSDNREYVYGMVSVTIIFFIGYLFITRPWW